MIEYIIPENPDDRIIDKACSLIREGGIIVAPSDTSWLMLTDPFNKKSVERLYKIKDVDLKHHFSLICSDISQASDVAIIENSHFRLLKQMIPGPYTFIFNATKKTSKTLKATKVDKEIGVRFPKNKLLNKLLDHYNSPLLSTNLNEALIDNNDSEIYGYMLEEQISHLVELILDPGETEFLGPSSIISLTDSAPEIIREGAGDLSFLK